MNAKGLSFSFAFLLLCALLVSSSVGVDAKVDGLMDRRLGKLQRTPKFSLFSKIRDAVTPGSPSSSRGTPTGDMGLPSEGDGAVTMDPSEGGGPMGMVPMMERQPVPTVEVEPKATGVRVTPTSRPPPAEVRPKRTAPMKTNPNCMDVAPDNVYTCAEQKGFGKCDAEFMVSGNYCAKTCGRPPCPAVMDNSVCNDIPPGPEHTCGEQRAFGKCDAEFMVMGNYCARTCGRSPCPPIDESCTTISEGVEGSSLLAFLDLALEVTDLKTVFDDPSLRVTVFAPTNVAFEDLLVDLQLSAEELLDFPEVLEEILGAHVLVEPLLASDLEDGAMFETMSQMSDLEISVDRKEVLVIPDYGLPAEVVSTDLEACGSVVHVIDTVLIPDREILLTLDLPDMVIANYETMAMRARGLL